MSLHAGFLKRVFAFFVDITVVIAICCLLYLFPFSLIINSGIDEDYETNVQDVIDEVNAEYSGETSLFGSSTVGLLTVLDNYREGTTELTSDAYTSYLAKHQSLTDKAINLTNELDELKDVQYSDDTATKNQFYTKVYELYGYLDNAYSCLYNNPYVIEDENYILLNSNYATANDLTDDRLTELQNDYLSTLKEDYSLALEHLIGILNVYDELNENKDVSKTLSYETISKKYSNLGVKDSASEYVESNKQNVLNFINKYNDFALFFTDTALVNNDLTKDEAYPAYLVFRYNLLIEESDKLLNVYEKYDEHSLWVVVYALCMFTLVYSVYTLVMRGDTFGRKASKIKLTDGAEREKLSPVKALLHDVPFKFLYLLLIGSFNLIVMLGAMLVFTIADLIMIKFTKSHKTIRDYLSGTKVIQVI